MTNLANFPAHWEKKKLGEIRERSLGGLNPQENPDEIFELYSIPGYDKGEPEFLKGSDIGSRKKILTPNSVLLSKINPRINRVWIVKKKEQHRQVGSTEWIVFEQGSVIEQSYLKYFLQNPNFRNYLQKHVSGVGGSLMRVSLDSIEKYSVPIPPQIEQKRIVAKIEELISKLDSAVDELEDTGKRLGQYQRSVLKAAISGRISERWREVEQREHSNFNQENSNQYQDIKNAETKDNYPETWRVTTLDQISDVETGATPLRGNNEYWGGDIPWVKSGAVNKTKIREAEEFITQKALDDTSVQIFPPGTLVVAMYGATRGKHSILEIEATTNQACAGVILSKEFSFLRSWIDIYLSHNYETLKSKGAGGAQINLNLGIIRSIEIPLPPEKEIEHICDIVERRMSIIHETGRTVSKCLNHAKRLRQSILKHAFEGNLVPQEPTEKTSAPEGKDTNYKTGSQATFPEVTSDVE